MQAVNKQLQQREDHADLTDQIRAQDDSASSCVHHNLERMSSQRIMVLGHHR